MGTLLWLATEASAAETGGFGLNLDLLETNLINLVIVIGVLIYFGRGFLGKTLSDRRSTIEEAIKEAETRQRKAAENLAEAQQKLTQAQAEAEKIKAEASKTAQAAREVILAQAVADVERLKAEAARDLDSERDRAIAQLRARVTALALQRVESQLQDRLDDYAQQQLIDRSIALLGGR